MNNEKPNKKNQLSMQTIPNVRLVKTSKQTKKQRKCNYLNQSQKN